MTATGLWIMGLSVAIFFLTLLASMLADDFSETHENVLVGCGILFCVGFVTFGLSVFTPSTPTAEELKERQERQVQIDELKKPKLFAKDENGCSVYRFVSHGNEKFYVTCDNQKSVTVQGTIRRGKRSVEESITAVKE